MSEKSEAGSANTANTIALSKAGSLSEAGSSGNVGGSRRVTLFGRANTGKTSLLMHLTGSLQRPVNFPGTSVESVESSCSYEGCQLQVVDLPGVASLTPQSRDEQVAIDSVRDAARQEIHALKRENGELKQLVADLSLEAFRLTKTAMPMMEDGVGTSA